jgi:two-component system response regulator CitB
MGSETRAATGVLIVEDVDAMRELLVQLVAGLEGFRVSGAAGNTWEARLELQRRRPQLVLLDEVLPGESSLDLLGELKDQEIPVLLLTGLVEIDRPLPPGAFGRLSKPQAQDWEDDRQRFARALRQALATEPPKA